jgi:hypothetical protein
MARESSRRQKLMHQALLKHQALIVTGPRGRRSLLIQSGEMSNPAEGAHRVTEYLEDGPSGHTTRKTITELAKELSRDLHPETIEPATEAEVMAWMSTPAFEEGTKRVLEVQRWNAGQRD